jgi:hypothetical protein
MAPEQVEHPREVDHRADIFSLGVVFYEMLTGELPLGKFQPPSHRAEMDVRLDEVVMRTLEKEPQRRYQQAGEVRTAVETISNTAAPALAATPEPARPAGSRAGWSRRDRWWLALALRCGALLPGAVSLPGPWSGLLILATVFGAGFALVALAKVRLARDPLLAARNRRRFWGATAAIVVLAVGSVLGLLKKSLTPASPSLPARNWPLPRRPEGPPYFAYLESGRFEVVAVRTLAGTNQSWWSPDGSPSDYGSLIRPLPHGTGRPGLATNQDNVQFLLRSDLRFGEQWKEARFTDLYVDPALGDGEGRFERLADRGHFAVWGERITQPASTVTLSLTLAAGPWTTLSTQTPGVVGWFKSSPGRKYWKWSEEFGHLDVTLEHLHRDPDWVSELVVVDGRRRLYTPSILSTTTRSLDFYGTSMTARFNVIEWEKPLQIQLRTRPYETVEFRNISLVPGRKTQLEIVDRTPLPESQPPRITAALEPVPEPEGALRWRWRVAKPKTSRILYGVEEIEVDGLPVSACLAELRDRQPVDGTGQDTNDLVIAVSPQANQTLLAIEDPDGDLGGAERARARTAIPSETWRLDSCQFRPVTLTDTHYQTLLEAEVRRPSADGKGSSRHLVRFIARLAPSEQAAEVRMLGKSDPVKTVLPVAN